MWGFGPSPKLLFGYVQGTFDTSWRCMWIVCLFSITHPCGSFDARLEHPRGQTAGWEWLCVWGHLCIPDISSGEKARCHIIKTAAPSCSPQHNRHVIKTYQNLDIARTCTLSRQPQLWFGISPWFVLVSVSWLQLVTSKIPAWPGGSIAQSCSELRSGVQTLFWKDGDLERPWPNGTNGSTHLFLVSTLYN